MGDQDEVDLDKEVFTTFEVASICNANITSIKNWIDQGELQAHRTPGGHFRIKKKVLKDFLNRHDMPNPFAERERKHIFVLHGNPELEARLRSRFGEIHRYDTRTKPLEALLKIGQWRPDAAVIEDGLTDIDPIALCEAVRSVTELRTVDLIIVHDRGEAYGEELREAGAKFVVESQEGENAIFEAVRRSLL